MDDLMLARSFELDDLPPQDDSGGAIASTHAVDCGSAIDEFINIFELVDSFADNAETNVCFLHHWSASSVTPSTFTTSRGLNDLASLGSAAVAINDDLTAVAHDEHYDIGSDKRKADDFDDEDARPLTSSRSKYLRGEKTLSKTTKASNSESSSKDIEIEAPTACPCGREPAKEHAVTPKQHASGPSLAYSNNVDCGGSLRRETNHQGERHFLSPLKPVVTTDKQRARASHNVVEKHYRTRLNVRFERLLSVLPDEHGGDHDSEDRQPSKAGVLDAARRRILSLEAECKALKQQKSELAVDIGQIRDLSRRTAAGDSSRLKHTG